MKKLLVLFLSLILSLSAIGLVACGDNTETPGGNGGGNNPPEYTVEGTPGLRYSVYGQGDNQYAAFIGVSRECTEKDIVIASHYNGVKVTEIGDGVNYLSNFKEIESVKIHKYVKLINSSAFNSSKALKKVDFDDECDLKIGSSAFKNCTALEEFNYKTPITYLGDYAFTNCTSLPRTEYEGASYLKIANNPYAILNNGLESDSVKVHKDCVAIQAEAFLDKTSLKTVTFESDTNLNVICGFSFKQTGITEISIPTSVKMLGEEAFYGCASLEKVTFSENSECNFMGVSLFQSCSALKEAVNFNKTKITIAPYSCFQYCSEITSISFPETLTLIQTKFMWDCKKLLKVNFPKNCQITEIEYSVFRNAKDIDYLIIPKSVQKVGYNIAGWAKTSFVFYCEGTYNASWHKNWNCRQGEEFHKVYYYSDSYKAGAWHYVNGEPTLW